MTTADPTTDEDAIIVALSDYFDGTLPADKKREVEAKIANDPAWKALHDEMLDAQKSSEVISGLMKARAPETFDKDVTGMIHKRSGGRFFGRRTFGDRVPVGVLVIIALVIVGVVAYVLWTSQTGSLKVHKEPTPKVPPAPLLDKP
jgi:anti-sigma factor RsiW